jgi:uncharacterized membrane protein YidH (DUF202 family)
MISTVTIDRILVLVAQTATTLDKSEGARNNAALPAMFLAVLVLGALALATPRWARAINRRREARTTA